MGKMSYTEKKYLFIILGNRFIYIVKYYKIIGIIALTAQNTFS